MKTEKELQDFLFEKNHDAFSIAAAVQCAFRLLEKDTIFIADAVKVHLQHEILEFAKAYAQQRVEEDTRWIPVRERLPVEDEIVLCYYDGEVFTGYIQILYSDGTARFKQPYGMFSANMYNIPVTHWQPLPKAPTV